jgi:hypothetical protein
MRIRGKRAPKVYTSDHNSGFALRLTLGEASFPNELSSLEPYARWLQRVLYITITRNLYSAPLYKLKINADAERTQQPAHAYPTNDVHMHMNAYTMQQPPCHYSHLYAHCS